MTLCGLKIALTTLAGGFLGMPSRPRAASTHSRNNQIFLTRSFNADCRIKRTTTYEGHPSLSGFVLCHVAMNHGNRQGRRQGASTFSTGHNGTMALSPGVLLCRWGARNRALGPGSTVTCSRDKALRWHRCVLTSKGKGAEGQRATHGLGCPRGASGVAEVSDVRSTEDTIKVDI